MVVLNAERIFVALDNPDPEEARALMQKLAPMGCSFKIGLTLFPRLADADIAEFAAMGAKIFLDYKFHDIAQTVAGAVRSVCLGAGDFLTVHAEIPVMKAAVAAKGDHPVKLLGVTVLSSLDDQDLFQAGYQYNVRDLVLRRALAAQEAGMDGLICSPLEAGMLREALGDEMILVTPGVRPSGADTHDQKRCMTPLDAVNAGADYLVIGRPITLAEDPQQALKAILESLDLD